ncbi:hypothetical protein [Pedobacter sp. L105]|uniref:hypothetical protein n=1 Tax=Pedobacter sp. L105 TaxID=1641871 RepID=UPI00131D417C|nr:hypothetical protein [Pedobacter sp. L105]
MMKNLSLLLLLTGMLSVNSYAQNTFPATGNVGINTTNPKANFSVNGTALLAGGQANIDPLVTTNAFTYLANTGQLLVAWNRTASEGETDFIANRGGGGQGGYLFYDYSNTNVLTQLVRITGSGNVGIGVANPVEKLAVNGTIHSKEVKVDMNNWADYVFKKEYLLLPLSEVQTYIDKNQHLPDMPSESELVKSGLNVGEMNKILTKKVEELTLYLIENQKELQELEQEVKLLNKKVDTLSNHK